jgi:hypothetical protein
MTRFVWHTHDGHEQIFKTGKREEDSTIKGVEFSTMLDRTSEIERNYSVAYAAPLTACTNNRTVATIARMGRSTVNMVVTAGFTEVRTAVDMVTSAGGSMTASTNSAIARKITSSISAVVAKSLVTYSMLKGVTLHKSICMDTLNGTTCPSLSHRLLRQCFSAVSLEVGWSRPTSRQMAGVMPRGGNPREPS